MEILEKECEMYERIIAIKDEEIQRLYELLKLQKTGSHTQKLPSKITGQLMEVIDENIKKLDDNEIRKHLMSPSPAYKSVISMLQKVFKSNEVLCNINYQNYITYMNNDTVETIYYMELFDETFKKVYEKCAIACQIIHDNIITEHDNHVSDYCHENIMMLYSDNERKTRLQKELLKVIKPSLVQKG